MGVTGRRRPGRGSTERGTRGGGDSAGAGRAWTCRLGRTGGLAGLALVGRRCVRALARSDRLTAATVRAGESGTAETLGATAGLAGAAEASAGTDGAVSRAAGS